MDTGGTAVLVSIMFYCSAPSSSCANNYTVPHVGKISPARAGFGPYLDSFFQSLNSVNLYISR